MITHLCHKTLKRWSLQSAKTMGIHVSPQTILILSAIALISLIQILMYIMLSSQTIYCQLPNMRFRYHCQVAHSYEKLPTIYVVTPTYARHVQKAELIRLSHTLMLVPNLHWIIVEDSDRSTDLVWKFVIRLKDEFDFHTITRLQTPTPEAYKLKPGQPGWRQPKGVWQRNKALEWIWDNLADLDRDGVIYFADDDNTYDLELFNEMRNTRRVSVWPVGFVGGLLVERPIVDPLDHKQIKSFNSMWANKRPFPIDMAGFAISLQLLISRSPGIKFSAQQKIGYVESHFLGQLVDSWAELEPRANRCSKVLVWHTQTKSPALHEERKLAKPSHSEIEW